VEDLGGVLGDLEGGVLGFWGDLGAELPEREERPVIYGAEILPK
jgi:hypothetical protein